MTSGNATSASARNTCKHPGCGEPAAWRPAGSPAGVLRSRGHTKVTAWRERRRLPPSRLGPRPARRAGSPVTMAGGRAELLRALRAEADRVSGIATG